MIKSRLILLALIVTFQACGQSINDNADSIMSGLFRENGPGGIALVVKSDEILYRKAFGLADMELGVKMIPENIMRIGSLTKQFTACAILKLEEEGKLNLKDDITEYIDDYPSQGQKITIEHLLTHTSGIKDFSRTETWTADLKKMNFSPRKKIDFFKNEPMDFAPGEAYKYNNNKDTGIPPKNKIVLINPLDLGNFSNFFSIPTPIK